MVLAGHGIFGLGENAHQIVFGQIVQCGHHRQAADKFGNHPEFDQVFRLDRMDIMPCLEALALFLLTVESDHPFAHAALDDVIQPHKGATANEQDVFRIDRNGFLLRMLAPALRRHVGNSTFENLEQPLLHALARYIARDGHVFGAAGDFVNFVNIDDAHFRTRNIAIRRADQPQQYVFDIVANIAGFGDGGRIRNAERHIQNAGQCSRQQGLAAAGRPDHQDVALVNFNIVVGRFSREAELDPLVVIVHSHGQHFFDALLPHHIFIELGLDFVRLGHLEAGGIRPRAGGALVARQHRVAHINAIAADAHVIRAGDHGFDRLALAAAKHAEFAARR